MRVLAANLVVEASKSRREQSMLIQSMVVRDALLWSRSFHAALILAQSIVCSPTGLRMVTVRSPVAMENRLTSAQLLFKRHSVERIAPRT
jgi:hypothetical protein